MAMRPRVLLLFLLPVFSASAFAQAPSTCLRTFFIDFATGSDKNNGTSKTTPWQHAPGMNGFSAAYSHIAGDCFIFKGGVTWPVLVFPMTIVNSGTVANPDYYGVDNTFFSGTSFARPIFDGQHIGPLSMFLDMTSFLVSNTIIDNIEFRNQLIVSPGSFGKGMAINAFGPNVTIQNVFIHGWTLSAACDQTTDGKVGGILFGDAGANAGNVVKFSTIDGTGSGGVGTGIAMPQGSGGIARFNTIHDVSGGINSVDTIQNNVIFNINRSCSDPTFHEDGIITLGGPVTISGNIIHDIFAGVSVLTVPTNGATNLYYNNVIYNTASIPLLIDPNGFQSNISTAKVLNNTLQTSGGAAVFIVAPGAGQTLGTLVTENNHWITEGANPVCTSAQSSGCAPVTTWTNDHNVLQTNATATSQGYTVSDNFAPTAKTDGTIGAGTNLTSLGISNLNQDMRGAARPSTSPPNWDAGAFQLTLPNPPVNLRQGP